MKAKLSELSYHTGTIVILAALFIWYFTLSAYDVLIVGTSGIEED